MIEPRNFQEAYELLRDGVIPPSARAARVLEWIEATLRVPDGPLAGQPMRLTVHQRNKIAAIFHFPDRLPRRVLISEARKNAKTALCAILVLVFVAGPEAKPQLKLVSTGMTRDQAAILHGYAEAMVQMSPGLAHVKKRGKELYVAAWGTRYKALSSDASSNIGQSPAIAIHDELGEVRGPTSALYSAVETGMMAHASPMSLVISTQARNDTDLLSTLIDDMRMSPQDGDLLIFWHADPDVYNAAQKKLGLPDEYTEEALRAANPEFGILANAVELLRLAAEAQRLPSLDGEYKNRNLNQRIAPFATFVPKAAWVLAATGKKDPPKDRPLWLGLDLSEVGDLTGMAAVWDEDDGALGVWAKGWIPEEGLRERALKDRVPYDVWAKNGQITAVPGNAIDYPSVAEDVVAFWNAHKIHAAGFDRWQWRHFKKALKDAGMPAYLLDDKKNDLGRYITGRWYPVGAGTQTMTPVLRHIEELLLAALTGPLPTGKWPTIRHCNSPVLNMCATNAVAVGDAEARRLSKRTSKARIDLFMAVAIAIAAKLESPPPPKSVGQIRIL